MNKAIRVLMIEDSENDAVLCVNEMKTGGFDPYVERIETREEMEKALDAGNWDVILCDYKMPKFSAPEALGTLKNSGKDIPLIVVSGTVGEDVAVGMMKMGANDYVMKNNLIRLCPDIEREIRDFELRRKGQEASLKLEIASEEWQKTFDTIADMAFVIDKGNNIIKWNKAFLEGMSLTEKDITEKKCYQLMHKTEGPPERCPFTRTKEFKIPYTEEFYEPSLDKYLRITTSPILGGNSELIAAVHIARDISREKKQQEENRKYLEQLEVFYNASVGREEKIMELKEEIRELRKQINNKA